MMGYGEGLFLTFIEVAVCQLSSNFLDDLDMFQVGGSLQP